MSTAVTLFDKGIILFYINTLNVVDLERRFHKLYEMMQQDFGCFTSCHVAFFNVGFHFADVVLDPRILTINLKQTRNQMKLKFYKQDPTRTSPA
jgi:hypothetical protein